MNIYSDFLILEKREPNKKRRKEKKNIEIPISPHTKRYMDSKEKGMNGYTIAPHAKQYIESKGKDVNRYTYLSSHQTRQRMKARENVKRRMDILYLLIPTTKQNQRG